MKRPLPYPMLVLVIGSAFMPTPVFGQSRFAVTAYSYDGNLDGSFSGDGKLTTTFAPDAKTSATAVAPWSGVATVVAGTVDDMFAITRYNISGALDSTFGSGGKVLTSLGNCEQLPTHARAIAVRNNKILVAGGFCGNIAIVRYNADGSLDSTFGGGDGTVLDDIVPGVTSDAFALVVDDNSRIVVVGKAWRVLSGGWTQQPTYIDEMFVIARYNWDGTRDGLFGAGQNGRRGGGLRIWNVMNPDENWSYSESNSEEARAVAIHWDGRIIVSGRMRLDFPYISMMTFLSLDVNGGITQSFGGGVTDLGGEYSADFGAGIKIVAFPNETPDQIATVNGVAIDSGGRIIGTGAAQSGSSHHFAVVRLNANGSLDTTFSGDGKTLTPMTWGGWNSEARALSLDFAGNIMAAGWVGSDTERMFAVARYLPNGSLDQSFSGDGRVLTDVGCMVNDDANAMAFAFTWGFARILVAGHTWAAPCR